MANQSKDFLKTYYYDVLHWQIKAAIFYVRNNSYPPDYWKESLKKSLCERNRRALQIINGLEPFANEQLKLF